MKKIHKIITGSALSMIMAISSISGVSAATSISYSATVNKGGEPVTVTTANPSSSYQWALNYLPTRKGGKVISQYHAAYGNSSFVQNGENIELAVSDPETSAIWKPSGISNYPAFFGTAGTFKGKNCSGSYVSSSYCALNGRKYKLILKNTSPQNATVSGQYTLTEH